MDHCIPAQLICHPQLNILTFYFKTSPMGNGCGKHGAMNSIYWQIMQYTRAWALLFPLQTDLIFQLHHIVATLVPDFFYRSKDSAAPITRCRHLSEVVQLPRVLSSSSLLLIMLTQLKDAGWPKHIPWMG